MSARDLFHKIVKKALQKDDWTITHDPYPLATGSFDLAIDLGAEKIIAAHRGEERIAIEIKSFLGPSKISQFYGALGQFIAYRTALHTQDPNRILYLAVPDDIYDRFFLTPFVQELVTQNQLYILTYAIEAESLEKWIPLPNTVSKLKPS
ncbi:fdxN element excision controlling factor protein [Pseudanabaena sp. lw0831]|uniref:element excision factor XisH family protein n=1 Tax=Pseudanabaena sp. lw0831 TaxID=1357935 RepID=UPI0019153235|nr:element excision factor XisH family protein [Pseudanabaena sp. lw0831]GBO55974.1 fdxN element excision controlling factor protein [Pseudanabaena sp. lw0831]